MKRILLLLVALSVFNFSKAQDWKVKSYAVSFSIKHAMGSTANGTFSNLSSVVYFDPLKLNEAKIIATVDASTFNTGNSSRDKTVKSTEYFDVVNYPKITMKLLKVTGSSAMNFTGTFAVTIKNITKEVTFPFTFIQNGKTAVFKGEFIVNRLDYLVGESSWLLGDEATVKIVLNVNQ